MFGKENLVIKCTRGRDQQCFKYTKVEYLLNGEKVHQDFYSELV